MENKHFHMATYIPALFISINLILGCASSIATKESTRQKENREKIRSFAVTHDGIVNPGSDILVIKRDGDAIQCGYLPQKAGWSTTEMVDYQFADDLLVLYIQTKYRSENKVHKNMFQYLIDLSQNRDKIPVDTIHISGDSKHLIGTKGRLVLVRIN